MKNFRSKASRTAARMSLALMHKRDREQGSIPKRYPMPLGGRWIHGGPNRIEHPRYGKISEKAVAGRFNLGGPK